jgi:hypothetical protein
MLWLTMPLACDTDRVRSPKMISALAISWPIPPAYVKRYVRSQKES